MSRVARTVAVGWAGFVIVMGLGAWSDVDDDARPLIVGATVLALVAALWAVVAVDRARPAVAGVALIVTGVAAPTYAAVWCDLLPIGVGIALLVRARRPRRKAVDQP